MKNAKFIYTKRNCFCCIPMSINDFSKMTILVLFNIFFHLSKNSTCLQTMAVKCFLEKVPDDSLFCVLHRNSRCWLNYFWQKVADHSANTLRAKTFVKIALPRTVSEIKAFLRFTQNSRWLPKMAGKRFLGKKWQMTEDTLKVEIFVEIALSCTISEINASLHFT